MSDRREYHRKYREEHQEKIREDKRKYRKKHAEEIREYNNKYRKEHPEWAKERSRKYYQEHLEQKRESSKKYKREHPERVKRVDREWREKNKERLRRLKKEWKENHPEEVRELARKYSAQKRATLQGNLDARMAKGIGKSLRKNKAGRKWEELVGYTVDDLKIHLEKLFKNGLTWEIFFKEGYHIDHIKPKSLFHYELAEDEEFQKCWALENLQPLEAIVNIKKSNKYDIGSGE